MDGIELMKTLFEPLGNDAPQAHHFVADFQDENGADRHQQLFPLVPAGMTVETATQLVKEALEQQGRKVMVIWELIDPAAAPVVRYAHPDMKLAGGNFGELPLS